jgi:Tfp pilus assembly major pilin PilA
MKILRNEKGFALVLVMILAVIALVMTAAMLLMVSRGSYVSGQQKRYRTALEASRGGAEAIMDVIATRPATMGPSLVGKLGNRTNNWAYDNTLTIDPVTPTTYDMTVDLGMYRVYVKVVDTVLGNTGLSTGLMKSGVVTTSPSEISGMAIPYLYTIEVLSQSTTNSTERSKLSVLYQY